MYDRGLLLAGMLAGGLLAGSVADRLRKPFTATGSAHSAEAVGRAR